MKSVYTGLKGYFSAKGVRLWGKGIDLWYKGVIVLGKPDKSGIHRVKNRCL